MIVTPYYSDEYQALVDNLVLNGCAPRESTEHGCRVVRWVEGKLVMRAIENYDGSLDFTAGTQHYFYVTCRDILDLLVQGCPLYKQEVDWLQRMEMEIWDDDMQEECV